MQQAIQDLRENLWAKLKIIYERYAKVDRQIPISLVQTFLEDVLGQVSKYQKDYVMKNMFRLDVDGSGLVSFVELGNFLFKKHCGQMSLQRSHQSNKIKYGSDRKMDCEQFNKLLDQAYSFLNVVCPPDVVKGIFVDTDKDEDKLITYVEYFQVIDRYLLRQANYKVAKSDEKPKEEKPLGTARHSKLRRHIWACLIKLYEFYVNGRNLYASDKQVKGLVTSIVRELSASELGFLLSCFLKLNLQQLTLVSFAPHFIYIIAELGLSRYSASHPSAKKTLNRDEFIVLLKNIFSWANLARFKHSILYTIFFIIDNNKDGLISFDQYLHWVNRFLAVEKYYGDQFYVSEDDYDVDNSDAFEKPPQQVKTKSSSAVNFHFSEYTFAKQVRKRMLECLIPYDINKDRKFDKGEIEKAMVGLLKQNQNELKYVTNNVFRYDKDGDDNVTYIELTDFCVEQHFGEMAIQRLHRTNFYIRGKERIMNESQFCTTLNDALKYIEIKATPQQIHRLLTQIDLDNDGWISYQVYFLFLKYYFGSRSAIYPYPFDKNENYSTEQKCQKPVSDGDKFFGQYNDLDPFERFKRIIRDQLKSIFMSYDVNHNNVFETDQIQAILEYVFQLHHSEIKYLMSIYFAQEIVKGGLTLDQLISVILSIYFIEILFKRKYNSSDSSLWHQQKINLEQFISLVHTSCFFILYKPCNDDLKFIFEQLDTNKDGFISYKEYCDFITKYLAEGNSLKLQQVKVEVNANGIDQIEKAFLSGISDALKKHFDHYDVGAKGFLNNAELKLFLEEQLNETSQRQLDYVFWNLFRVDPDKNLNIEFFQFAPFILNHAGQISLQRFQKQQVKGKRLMNKEQLQLVIQNAYIFVVSSCQTKKAIPSIYKRITKGEGVGYVDFFQWVHNTLSSNYTTMKK